MRKKILILIVISLTVSFSSIRAGSDLSVRNNIINKLSEIKNSKDYNFVKKYLLDENDEFKIAAIYALTGLDKTLAISDLRNIYSSSSYEVKRNIIYVLGELKSNDNISFLTEILNSSEKTDLNNEAIIALIKINDKEVIKPLINYLNQFPENKVLIKQMHFLGVKLIEPLFLNLSEKDEKNYILAKIIIQEIVNENTKDALIEIIKLSVSSIEPVSRLANELISERKEDALLPAVALFQTANGRLKEQINVYLCNNSDNCDVVDNLKNIWKESKDEDLKIEIINIISSQNSKYVKSFLMDNITDPSEKIRNHIMTKMEPKENYSKDVFALLIKTHDKEIRSYYKDALVYLGGGSYLMLLRLLPDEEFSNDAEDIMIRLKGNDINNFLINNLINNEKGIDPFRERIRSILVKKAPESTENLLEQLKDRKKTEECKKILLMIGKQTVPQLINILKEDSNDLQTYTAAEILFEFGTDISPDLIKELTVEDLLSKMNIANVLVKLKNKEVIPSLIEILGSDESALRFRAIYALRDLGAVSVPELIKNLDSSKENTFIGIIRSLGEIKDKSAIPPLKIKLASTQNEKLKAEIEKTLKMLGE